MFGPPPVLEGEDTAAYDELFARLRAAVTPADIIDEMLIADVAYLEWEVLRWRRLKLSLIRARGLKALKTLVHKMLRYYSADYSPDYFADHFADYLMELLHKLLPDQSEDFARTLAHRYVRNNSDAIRNVNAVLAHNDLKMFDLLNDARERKVEELVQGYVRRKLDDIMLIDG